MTGTRTVIAICWSFTDEMQQIPYQIIRIGLPKNEGGNGAKFTCTCPAFTFRGSTCKHILMLRNLSKDNMVQHVKQFQLTDEGKKILRQE